MATPRDPVSLAQWRQSVADMYSSVRQHSVAEPHRTWLAFRAARDALFSTHPQSPLDEGQKRLFSSLDYYSYGAHWRVAASVDGSVSRQTRRVSLGDDGQFAITKIATLSFTLIEGSFELSLYWVEGYGGGLFLPFRDLSSRQATYGGGRYLWDSIKGADLGFIGDRIILDFNYAYNPSCAYNPCWVCPLSPDENQLELAVEAGERAFALSDPHV